MTVTPDARIGVIGAGAWGTALAIVAAQRGPVTLWAREPDVVEAVNRERANPRFLPGVALPPQVTATGDMAALAACAALLAVAPAQHLRATLSTLPAGTTPLVLCSKGLEAGTAALMSEVAAEATPGRPLAVLSGPSLAREVAIGLPAALTLACSDAALGTALVARLSTPRVRLYRGDDLVGAEIGGAVKNVLAIACGAAAGTGLGENSRAALIARGFAEMVRYGLARGGRAETMAGLSGLGDLVLTCTAQSSRNFALGRALGEGLSATEALAGRDTVVEGAATAPVLATDAARRGVDMPISAAVAAVLAGRMAASDAVETLLARPLAREG